MSLDLKCEICDSSIDAPGALLFSPPIEVPPYIADFLPRGAVIVVKHHFCTHCYTNNLSKHLGDI